MTRNNVCEAIIGQMDGVHEDSAPLRLIKIRRSTITIIVYLYIFNEKGKRFSYHQNCFEFVPFFDNATEMVDISFFIVDKYKTE